jgi:hypothetical protein
MASSGIVTKLVGGIYASRNHFSSRQGARVEIGPGFDTAALGPNVDEFPAEQALVYFLEFVEVSECSLRIAQNEKVTLYKPVRSRGEHRAGIVFILQSIEVGANSA